MFRTINGGIMPTRETRHSACVDLYANEDITIRAGETAEVSLGVCIDHNFIENMEENWAYEIEGEQEGNLLPNESLYNRFLSTHFIQLSIKRSLAMNGLQLANGINIIDLDFAEEFKAIIHNPVKMTTVNPYPRAVKRVLEPNSFYTIKKGEKIAQATLVENKSSLFDIDTNA